MDSPCIHLKIILDKRYQKKDKTYPVKLRVIYKQQPRAYSLGYSFTVQKFDKIMGQRPQGENKAIREHLERMLAVAREKCFELESFSFESFSKIMQGDEPKKQAGLYDLFDRYLAGLKAEKRVGTFLSTQDALNSLKKFCPQQPALAQVSPAWLKRYQAWMLAGGKSETTVGMYTRSLRAVYNYAIELNQVDAKYYPFGKGKYAPPVGKTMKKALSEDQVKAIAQAECSSDLETLYRDFWMFSFYCNGANMADVLRLSWESINDGFIVFRREKTKRTRRGSQKDIVVPLSYEIDQHINTYQAGDESGLIFPFLKTAENEFHARQITNEFIKQTNKHVGMLARRLGIEEKVTTYTARHSWATIMERKGAPVGIIRDGLGHTSTKTTEDYLAGFDREAIKHWSKKLLE
jgi:integrase/recombinase XerD